MSYILEASGVVGRSVGEQAPTTQLTLFDNGFVANSEYRPPRARERAEVARLQQTLKTFLKLSDRYPEVACTPVSEKECG